MDDLLGKARQRSIPDPEMAGLLVREEVDELHIGRGNERFARLSLAENHHYLFWEG